MPNGMTKSLLTQSCLFDDQAAIAKRTTQNEIICSSFMIFFLTVGSVHADPVIAPVKLEVFKSKTCGCCAKWIDQLNEKSFDAVGINLDQLGSFKSSKDLVCDQSCHTALFSNGFVSKRPYTRQIYHTPGVCVCVPGLGLDQVHVPGTFWKPGHGSGSSV